MRNLVLLVPASLFALLLFWWSGAGPSVLGVESSRPADPHAVPGAESVSSAAGVEVSTELASLVPTDAFLFLQIRSLDELDADLAHLLEILPGAGPEGSLRQAIEETVGNSAHLIDGTRPVGMALSLSSELPGSSEAIAILPLRDLDAPGRDGLPTGLSPEVPGSWVSVPLGGR